MKKALLATVCGLALAAAVAPASAADIPVKAPVYKAPVVVPYSWTGWYVGGNIGYSWGESDTTAIYSNAVTGAFIFGSSNSFDMNGVIGGLQIGYNWQNGKWVLGVEADIQLSGQDGGSNYRCSPTPLTLCNNSTAGPGFNVPPTASFNQSLDWFGTLRARLGWTVTPTVLAYLTGGLAYGGIDTDGTIVGTTGGGTFVSAPFSYSKTKAGWTIGGGIEGYWRDRWTWKVEYLYMDFGTISGSGTNLLTAPQLRANFSSDVTDHILRFGLNYKLGPTAVMVKY